MGNNLTGQSISTTYQQLVQISGSTLTDGTGSAINSLTVTVSNANNATSASHANNADSAISASYAVVTDTAVSASYAANATSASFASVATSASFATTSVSASRAATASFALTADSSSYALFSTSASQAQNANNALLATSASYATTALSASFATTSVSASQAGNANTATSASFATTSTSASYAATSTSASHAANADASLTATSASFATTSISSSYSAFALTASFALNAAGGAADTGSLLKTASISDATITFTKGDASTFNIVVNNVVNATSASLAANATTASYALVATSASQASNANTATSASYATNALSASFASTIPSNLNFTASSALINGNLNVTGTASFGFVETITGSAIIINEEFIILNAQTPTAPFAGIVVYDTGSASTASLEWNGNTDNWIVVEEQGASAMILTGLTGSKGSEVAPALNKLLKGTGNHTVADSTITDNGTLVTIQNNVSASGFVSSSQFVGNLQGTASFATTASFALNANPFPYTGNVGITGNINLTGSYNRLSGSFSGSAIDNITDIYTSTAKVNHVISLTQAEFNSISASADQNTLYYITDAPSFVVSASYALTSTSASHAVNADTSVSSSFSSTALSASYSVTATSASHAVNADSAASATSASFATNSTSASYALNSTSASYALNSTSASYAVNATSASYAFNATTASYALGPVTLGSNTFTGDQTLQGDLIMSASARSEVKALTISSLTASLDCTAGNFFTLTAVSGSNTFINPSNIQAGQTINLRITQPGTGFGTISFATNVNQVSGSIYAPTTASNAVDIVTLIAFDGSDLYLSNVKNLV